MFIDYSYHSQRNSIPFTSSFSADKLNQNKIKQEPEKLSDYIIAQRLRLYTPEELISLDEQLF